MPEARSLRSQGALEAPWAHVEVGGDLFQRATSRRQRADQGRPGELGRRSRPATSDVVAQQGGPDPAPGAVVLSWDGEVQRRDAEHQRRFGERPDAYTRPLLETAAHGGRGWRGQAVR